MDEPLHPKSPADTGEVETVYKTNHALRVARIVPWLAPTGAAIVAITGMHLTIPLFSDWSGDLPGWLALGFIVIFTLGAGVCEARLQEQKGALGTIGVAIAFSLLQVIIVPVLYTAITS